MTIIPKKSVEYGVLNYVRRGEVLFLSGSFLLNLMKYLVSWAESELDTYFSSTSV